MWRDLRDEVKSILELLDLSRKSRQIAVGETLNLCRCAEDKYGSRSLEWYEYVITSEDLADIDKYQHSTENEGYYTAILKDNVLDFTFIKSPFEKCML